MGLFTAGQVVLLPFPYTDLSDTKLRPCLLLASAGREDWIACQITSNPFGDSDAVALPPAKFSSGGLRYVSYLRPAKLFTAHESLVVTSLGSLTFETLTAIRQAVAEIVQR
jgi:mRNA interferase MazF